MSNRYVEGQGRITASEGQVVGEGTAFTQQALPGDWLFVFGPNYSIRQAREIVSIEDATHLTLSPTKKFWNQPEPVDQPLTVTELTDYWIASQVKDINQAQAVTTLTPDRNVIQGNTFYGGEHDIMIDAENQWWNLVPGHGRIGATDSNGNPEAGGMAPNDDTLRGPRINDVLIRNNQSWGVEQGTLITIGDRTILEGNLYAGLSTANVTVRPSQTPGYPAEAPPEGIAILGCLLNSPVPEGGANLRTAPGVEVTVLDSIVRSEGPAPKPDFAEPAESALPPPEPGERVGEVSLELAPGVTLTLAQLSPGSFLMGSPGVLQASGEPEEKPRRLVKLTRPFLLGVYELTQAQWEAVMGANPSAWVGPDLPVHNVTWAQAQQFIARLNERFPEGPRFRLSTEAEWEYACRASTQGVFFWGDDYGGLDNYAWHGGNSGGKPHPVGQKQSNPWGLYDVLGNVQEWCADWYAEDYYSYAPDTDPTGPDRGEVHVRRGGSWEAGGWWQRLASRNNPASQIVCGLRLAADLP